MRAGLTTKQDLGGAVNELKTAMREVVGRLEQKVEQGSQNSASTRTEAEKMGDEVRKLLGDLQQRIIDSMVTKRELDVVTKRLSAEMKETSVTNSKELSERLSGVSRALSERVSTISKELSERLSEGLRDISQRVSDGQNNLMKWVFALVVELRSQCSPRSWSRYS